MHDETFLRKTREQLDASEQSLDAAILSRLNQARQKALAQKTARSGSLWLPAAVTATLVAAVIGGTVLLQQPAHENMSQQFAYDDIEILVSDADIDLLQDMDMLEAMADDAS